ncbi:MAG: DoxX family membrane protein [Patescibacteria group bacterium]
MKRYIIEESLFSYFFTADTRSAALWLIVRVWLGWQWLEAGWAKLHNPAWWGHDAGAAISGFAQGALAKTGGVHPDVQWWYADFVQATLIAHPYFWSHLIVFGELAVGIGLILGCLTGIAAFFGVVMNLNFMLAGTVSVNPIWATVGVLIVLAWRVAGYWGADRYVLPLLHRTIRPRFQKLGISPS